MNLHEIYGDFGGTFVDRDQVEVKHFESWMQWAAENGIKLDFNSILLGHGKGCLLPKSKVYDFLEVAKNIDLNSSVKVSFKNFENSNSYCYTKGMMYNQDDTGVVFDPNKL